MSKAKRKPLTGLQRAKFFEDHGGICHICKCKIQIGQAWHDEHKIPRELANEDGEILDPETGEYIDVDDPRNRGPAHKACHKPKTAKDISTIAKCKRVKAKHIGAWPKSSGFKTNRNGPFKAKIGGGVERRD